MPSSASRHFLASRLARAVVAIAIAAAVLYGGGYALAEKARPRIESETRAYVLSEHISGRRLGGGKIPPEEIEVIAWVNHPFVVVGSYSVPFDMHAAYFRTTYLIMPWGRYVLSKEEFYPM